MSLGSVFIEFFFLDSFDFYFDCSGICFLLGVIFFW